VVRVEDKSLVLSYDEERVLPALPGEARCRRRADRVAARLPESKVEQILGRLIGNGLAEGLSTEPPRRRCDPSGASPVSCQDARTFWWWTQSRQTSLNTLLPVIALKTGSNSEFSLIRYGRGRRNHRIKNALAAKSMPIRKSITPDFLVCLDDGKRFKSLRRHLTGLGLTLEQYREMELPFNYPMVAPNYAA
jgi:hypothetical protein